MRNAHLLYLLIIALFLPFAAGAQQVRFFDGQYRLPGSLIDRIYQDTHGNLWLTGKSGAIKYSGTTFTRQSLRYPNAPSLPLVKCMEFLDNEKIIFGTSHGMVINDCLNDTIGTLPVIIRDTVFDNCYVSSVVQCKKLGALIVTCSGTGIAAFDLESLKPNKSLTDTLNNLINTRYPGTLSRASAFLPALTAASAAIR